MEPNNKEVFSKNLRMYISKKGKPRKDIAYEIGVSYSTLTDWINGNKYPRIDKIESLADYFGITKTDLIEDFDEIKKDNDRLVSVIVKLRTNKELLDVVEKLISLDKTKLEGLSGFLNSLIK